MKKVTIITTREDISVSLLSSPNIRRNWSLEINYYEDLLAIGQCPTFDADWIYLRDPFNSGIAPESLRVLLTDCLRKNSRSYFIDNIAAVDDIYLEDKWLQYQIFSSLMPKTSLFATAVQNQTANKPLIYKKRISSRARDVYFSPPSDTSSGYIEQERIEIQKEYRVIEVFKSILPKVLIKDSKTEQNKVKVLRSEDISDELRKFTTLVQKRHNFDLVGYDVARTIDGKFVLIEANRSPQINGYYREVGVNAFELLFA